MEGTGVAGTRQALWGPPQGRARAGKAAGAGSRSRGSGRYSPLASSLAAFVLKTHVCAGAQPGWKGHRHSVAPGDSAPAPARSPVRQTCPGRCCAQAASPEGYGLAPRTRSLPEATNQLEWPARGVERPNGSWRRAGERQLRGVRGPSAGDLGVSAGIGFEASRSPRLRR